MSALRLFTRRRLLIAGLLLFTAGAAVGVSQWRLARQRQAFIDEVAARGGYAAPYQMYSFSYGGSSPTFWQQVKLRFGKWLSTTDPWDVKLPTSPTLADVQRLTLLSGIESLTLHEADNAVTAAIPPLPLLKELTLHSQGRRMTDAALVDLHRFPHLKHVRFLGVQLTEVTTNQLARLNVTRVTIGDGTLTEAGFSQLLQSPNAFWLELHDLQLRGEELDRWTNEEVAPHYVKLSGNPLNESAMVRLYAGPQTRLLDLSRMPHGTAALDALATNQTLVQLHVNDVPIDPELLVFAVANHPKLHYLALGGKALKPEHLKLLLRMPALQELEIYRSGVTAKQVEQILNELDAEFNDAKHRQIRIHR